MANEKNNFFISNSSKLYGQSGALKDLLEKLGDSEICDVDDIQRFKLGYVETRRKKLEVSVGIVKFQLENTKTDLIQLKIERENTIKIKMEELNRTIANVEDKIARPLPLGHFISKLIYGSKNWFRGLKLKFINSFFQSIVNHSTRKQSKRIAIMEARIEYVEANIQEVARINIADELERLDRISYVIEKEKYLLYGAIGERDVINKLQELPATYHIINDFKLNFDPPIYNRAEDDRIYSVQIDHLVVGPTGLCIIETKNWSGDTIANDSLFSPVKQVKRAGFALFVFLNGAAKSNRIEGISDYRGQRKISPKQTVVFINSVPNGQFQFVKILKLERLNSYITYGNEIFSPEVIRGVVSFLLKCRLS